MVLLLGIMKNSSSCWPGRYCTILVTTVRLTRRDQDVPRVSQLPPRTSKPKASYTRWISRRRHFRQNLPQPALRDESIYLTPQLLKNTCPTRYTTLTRHDRGTPDSGTKAQGPSACRRRSASSKPLAVLYRNLMDRPNQPSSVGFNPCCAVFDTCARQAGGFPPRTDVH